jgi:hypothetical protein
MISTQPFKVPTHDAARAWSCTDRLSWYVGVARWAPSKHNTQGWRFVIRDGCIELWADPMRILEITDPHRRELTLSCGAALQLICVAARAAGYRPQVQVLPRGTDAPLARIVEVGPWPTDDDDRALLAAVLRRRTDRGPLDGDALPGQLKFELQTAALEQGAHLRLVDSPGERATLARLVADADRRLVQRPSVDEELGRWVRHAQDPRTDGVPDDHTRGPAASYRAEFVQRDFSTAHSTPQQNRDGPDRPLVAVLSTPSDGVGDWIAAGRALAAVLLRATAAGANASYLNQPVEDPAARVQLAEQLAVPGKPQLVLRLGTGATNIPPPPRRPLHEVLFVG